MDNKRTFLFNEIDKWIADKIITEEQGVKIKSKYEFIGDDRITNSDKFSSIFTSIGAILISLAALIFFGTNFESYSLLIQAIILFFGIVIFYILSIYFNKKFNKTSLAFYFIANVCTAFAIFFFANKVCEVFISDPSLIKIPEGGEQSSQFISKLRFSESMYSITNAIAGVLTTIVWIINANIKRFKFLSIMSSISIPFSITMLLQYLYLSFSKSKYFKGDPIYFIIIGIIMCICANYLQKKKYFAEAIYYVVGLLLIFIGLTIASETGIVVQGLSIGVHATILKSFWIIILTTCSFIAIWYGVKSKINRFLNIGLLFIGIDILFRYVDWFWKALPKTIFFLVGGILLLLIGIYFDKIKKKLISLIDSDISE